MTFLHKAKFLDLAATMPMITFLIAGIYGSLLELPQTVGSLKEGLTNFPQLASAAYFTLMIVLLVIRRTPVRKASGWLPRAAGLTGLLFPTLSLAIPKAVPSPFTSATSTALTILGTLISFYVCFWLGRSFSILPQARALVIKGPYRLVRHPLYLAEIITVCGLMFELERPWSFVFIFLAACVQLPRMYYEERVLSDEFPEYCAYASRTAILIPGLY